MNRKEFLRRSAVLGAGLSLAPACGLLDEPEMLLCELETLKKAPEGFKTFIFNRRKILLREDGEKLEIISLICTHRHCTVAYEAEEKIFACPCHEGTYDYEGRVIDGPPPRPLQRFAYEMRGNEIWVLNQRL